MKIVLQPSDLRTVEAHGEATYPNEGAGFLLGRVDGDRVLIEQVRPVDNRRESEAQHNRYELSPRDFAQAELEADRNGISIIGIFHSHPDHPAQPSQFDLDHALPNFTYFITSVEKGQARITRAWRLREDRVAFDEDEISIAAPQSQN